MAGSSGEHSDSTGEFFSVGTLLHAVRAGYIRRRADDLLFEAVVAGRYAHVIAPDRSGKSSLIAATAARLENNGFHVALLDLEQLGDRDSEPDAGRWYYSVAYRLLRQLRVRFELQSWWQDKSILSNRQRLLEFYSEVILQSLQQRVVVFVDGIQCIADLPFAEELLASIRSAHNARTTDPEFARLTFVLLGEADPLSLIDEPELSPFNITQAIPLDDFTREDLNLFATELNLGTEDSQVALDRIYHWTRGQPYLTQKLARAVSRDSLSGDIAGHVDRIVMQQLAGRAALHSEPHLSHIHREVVNDTRNCEALLNLYGRLRKGIEVPADLGSRLQRRLMAVGLIRVDESGELQIRNRIYETVFTARWANDNLPNHWRVPAIVVAALFILTLIPLWYTQWLPRSYVNVLTDLQTELIVAENAWLNLRSFPGHSDTADNLYRNFLQSRAELSYDAGEINVIASLAADLPAAAALPQQFLADFWDRQARFAMRDERRDEALLASLESLVLSTPARRNRAAMLVGDDYPSLLASLPAGESGRFVFNPANLLVTAVDGSRFSPWSLGAQGLTRAEDWAITALEVTPIVRRVIVDQEGTVTRAGLTLNISHPRIADLRVKVIAPSGRAVEVDISRERASSNEDLRIPAAQLQALLGESLAGTWSLSLRDEATGVAGHLVGWNLTLNSQGLVEDFQRGIGIPDPVERETDRFWISDDGRYAIARATQSDSARLWDLAFAKPVSTIAVSENEQLIGVADNARQLVTATLDSVHIWDTESGKRVAELDVGPASRASSMTADSRHLFVQVPGDIETRLELWSLPDAARTGELVVAGAPALVSLNASGRRIAVADYDRAIRIWDMDSGELVTQLDLPLQPSEIQLSAGGDVLGVVYGTAGIAVWPVSSGAVPLLEEFGTGRWQLAFSDTGARVIAGRPRSGYQVYDTQSGRIVGPRIGIGSDRQGGHPLAFSSQEDIVITGGPGDAVRFWRIPAATVAAVSDRSEHAIWNLSGDAVVAALPGAQRFAIADRSGHVHIIDATAGQAGIEQARDEVSFIGHIDPVRRLTVSRDGALLASVGADNSIRVWDSEIGLPRPFIAHVAGSTIERVAFSPDASLLGVLLGSRAAIISTENGEVVVEMELGEPHSAMAFGADNTLYLGSDTGMLNAVARDVGGTWALRRLWQGESGIRWLEPAPRGRHLVLVDQNNLARQFHLVEGRLGERALQLPSAVEDVAFSPSGSRVLFRTARWVHRASAAPAGLTALDSVMVPDALSGSRLVFASPDQSDSANADVFYLPVARDGGVDLASIRFEGNEGPGLFGNKESLLNEWRTRLAIGENAN